MTSKSSLLDDAFWAWDDDYEVPQPHSTRLNAQVLEDPLSQLNAPAPILLREEDPVSLAVKRMKKRRYGSVLVADESGRLIGIFTEADLVRTAISAANDRVTFDSIPVGRCMTRDPQRLRQTDTVAFALNTMAVGGHRHVPLVDEDDRPTAFVSIRGILKYLARV